MSKNVKYISSDHFGAPVMKGDRWGYCVEMLRICLCEGFNERTDVTDIEVIDLKNIKITFQTAHNYAIHQTIAMSGTTLIELNDEFFITKVDGLSIYVKPYNSIANIVGQVLFGLSTVKTKVAPLGFIEKFRDNNKSAFTTDEQEAFFVIDDNQPAGWWNTGNSPIIAPIVYMTDNLIDINTPGRYIAPYDIANPTWYSAREYTDTVVKMGLANFISYLAVTTNTGNNAIDRVKPLKYTIIGNGRIFYFIPIMVSSNDYNSFNGGCLYGFGKINNDSKNSSNLPYILMSTGNCNLSYKEPARTYAPYKGFPITNAKSNNTSSMKTGTFAHHILKIKNSTRSPIFGPNPILQSNNINVNLIPGRATTHKYPDPLTYKYYISPIHVNDGASSYLGKLSGLLWTYNTDGNIHKNNIVLKYKTNNDDKYLYVHNASYESQTNTASTLAQYIYNISLDNADWFNYD